MHFTRVRLAGLAAGALLLLAPSAALADTLTVDPADGNNACSRGSDNTCRTITQAIAAALTGDTVSILKGTYAESVTVPAEKDKLVIKGAAPADVKITGNGVGDVVTILGSETSLSLVTIETPQNAQAAVEVGAPGTVIDSIIASRGLASDKNEPVIGVTGAGGAVVSRAILNQNAGAVGTPAVGAAANTTVADSVVVSTRGAALSVTGGAGNLVQRSTLISTEASSSAVQVLSEEGSTAAKKLVADSTYLIGGANGSGFAVTTSGSDPGDVTGELRHVTIVGSKNGITLDGTEADPGLLASEGVGNITVSATASILHGTSTANGYEGGLLGGENSVKLTYSICDGPPATTETNGDVASAKCEQNTELAKLFVPNRLSLRPDAPVIDKGGAVIAGESDKDYENQPRLLGPATDMGADEYSNAVPISAFGITNANPRQNEVIGFVSGAQDAEQGTSRGGIVEWRWDFGDGVKETTRVGATTHAYPNTGTYNVTLTVVDAQGAVSEPARAQTVTVRDGLVPSLTVVSPKVNERLVLNRPAKKPRKGSKKKPRRPRPLPLSVLGTVADSSGVSKVEVSIRVLSRSKRRNLGSGNCEYYTGRVIGRRKCATPPWLTATLSGQQWALTTRRRYRLPAGRYELRVRATDATGLSTGLQSVKDGTIVRFRVK